MPPYVCHPPARPRVHQHRKKLSEPVVQGSFMEGSSCENDWLLIRSLAPLPCQKDGRGGAGSFKFLVEFDLVDE